MAPNRLSAGSPGYQHTVLCTLVFKPLRWGFKVAEFVVEELWELAGRPGSAAGAGRDDHAGEWPAPTDINQAAPPRPTRARPLSEAQAHPPAVAPLTTPRPAAAVPDQAVGETISGRPAEPIVSEAVHVSESAELVEEFADPGAEDGAGAEVRVAEPWEGYRSMRAAEIIDRIASASSAELAAVELYEFSGRKRKTVLAAAESALKRATPPG